MAVATFNSFNATPGGKGSKGILIVFGILLALGLLLYFWAKSKTKKREEEELRKQLKN